MKFLDLKEFHFDPVLWSRMDTATALRFYREYVHRHSVQNGQQPRFFEVDRSPAQMDPLWHTPKAGERTQYTARSPMELPAINQFQKPDWKVTRLGITPGRRDNFLVSTLDLQALDYFPTRGDAVRSNSTTRKAPVWSACSLPATARLRSATASTPGNSHTTERAAGPALLLYANIFQIWIVMAGIEAGQESSQRHP